MVGGFYLYVVYGFFPHFPNRYVGKYHIALGTFTYLWAFTNFLLACKTSPGIIDSHNVKDYLKKYTIDGALYEEGNKCSTCKIAKSNPLLIKGQPDQSIAECVMCAYQNLTTIVCGKASSSISG